MKAIPTLLMLSLLLATAVNAATENRAVEITIHGIGPAVDEAAFSTVKQIIGAAVSNGVIDRFIVYSYGIEGGFSACAQAAPKNKGLRPFIRQLRSVVPRPRTTAYQLRLVAACPKETEIMCAADVRQCPDGSYVGRLPPTCEFAACPGN